MAEDAFVIDAVTHAYNHTPENFADEVGAGAIAGLSPEAQKRRREKLERRLINVEEA